jgi:HTH-type transcriptional regulator/antitoxin HigA
MEQHQLKHADLPDLGSQGVVSELLSGQRELNFRQMRALAGRFGVAGGHSSICGLYWHCLA